MSVSVTLFRHTARLQYVPPHRACTPQRQATAALMVSFRSNGSRCSRRVTPSDVTARRSRAVSGTRPVLRCSSPPGLSATVLVRRERAAAVPVTSKTAAARKCECVMRL